MSETRPPSAPGGVPVLGHTLPFLRAPLRTLERWGRADGDVVRARVAGKRVVVVTGPDPVREILVTRNDAFRKAAVVRDRLGTLQGGSLVLLEGEEWRGRRRDLQPAFTPDRVAATAGTTTRYAADAVADLPTDETARVDRFARDLSLAILAKTLFGLELEGGETPIHEAADDIMARMDLGSVSTYLPEWVPTPTNRRFRRAVDTLHDRLDATVDERMAREDGGQDLLSTMVAAGLPRDQIRDELVAFLFAGFDSTATALSCTLALVSERPRVQSSLVSELDSELDCGPPGPEELSQLTYLDAVVRESLRLYPPQFILFREPTRVVDVGGHRIDAGTIVVVSPWSIHRDPRFFTDPERFRPDRWLRDGELVDDPDRPEHAYFPYGAGPRHCLGMRLANQTLKLITAITCRRRRLELVDEFSVSAGPTLSLDDGITIRAPQRDDHPRDG